MSSSWINIKDWIDSNQTSTTWVQFINQQTNKTIYFPSSATKYDLGTETIKPSEGMRLIGDGVHSKVTGVIGPTRLASLIVIEHNDVVVEGLFIEKGFNPVERTAHIEVNGGHYATIKDVISQAGYTGVRLTKGEHLHVLDCQIRAHSHSNILLATRETPLVITNAPPSMVSDVLIKGNLLETCGKDGIKLERRCKRVLIEGNTIRDNNFDGIDLFASGEDIVIKNNIITGNHYQGLDIKSEELSYPENEYGKNRELLLTGNTISHNKLNGIKTMRADLTATVDHNDNQTYKHFIPHFIKSNNNNCGIYSRYSRRARILGEPGLYELHTSKESIYGPGTAPITDLAPGECDYVPADFSILKSHIDYLTQNTQNTQNPTQHLKLYISQQGGQSKLYDLADIKIVSDKTKLLLPPTETSLPFTPNTDLHFAIWNDTPKDSAYNIQIVGNQITGNEGDGIHSVGQQISIVGNVISGNGRVLDGAYYGVYMIGLPQIKQYAEKVICSYNIIYGNGRDNTVDGTGLHCNTASQIIAMGNIFDSDNSPSSNHVYQKYGMSLEACETVQALGNYFPNPKDSIYLGNKKYTLRSQGNINHSNISYVYRYTTTPAGDSDLSSLPLASEGQIAFIQVGLTGNIHLLYSDGTSWKYLNTPPS